MTGSDRERVVRSSNFDKIVVEKTHRGIEASYQQRMHKFQSGMEPTGRARPVLEPINETKAQLLYEALGELLGDLREEPNVGGNDE